MSKKIKQVTRDEAKELLYMAENFAKHDSFYRLAARAAQTLLVKQERAKKSDKA